LNERFNDSLDSPLPSPSGVTIKDEDNVTGHVRHVCQVRHVSG